MKKSRQPHYNKYFETNWNNIETLKKESNS